MNQPIEVVYENGLLRPLEPLQGRFQENQRLTIRIERSCQADDWLSGADPTVSLEAVRRALSKMPGTLAQMAHAEREER